MKQTKLVFGRASSSKQKVKPFEPGLEEERKKVLVEEEKEKEQLEDLKQDSSSASKEKEKAKKGRKLNKKRKRIIEDDESGEEEEEAGGGECVSDEKALKSTPSNLSQKSKRVCESSERESSSEEIKLNQEESKTDLRQQSTLQSKTTPTKPFIKKPPPYRLLNHKDYDILQDPPFGLDQEIPFSFIADALTLIAKCKGENSKDHVKQILANVFRSVAILAKQQFIQLFYFFVIKLAPDYVGKETGLWEYDW